MGNKKYIGLLKVETMAENKEIIRIPITQYISAERVWKPHLIALLVAKNKDKKIIFSLPWEGWDLKHNEFENILKEICDFEEINYSNISIEGENRNLELNYFEYLSVGHFSVISWIDQVHEIPKLETIGYGQFYGRATADRLYSFYKHISWQNKNLGLASMHLDLKNTNEKESEFYRFLVEKNSEWNKIKSLLPYSDIDSLPDTKILHDPAMVIRPGSYDFWPNVYKKMLVEVVAETNTLGNGFYITEKTMRPMLFGRIFVTIATSGFEQKLKELGFDIFDDLVDKSYDFKSGYDRIDHLYSSLDRFLKNNTVDIFEKIKSRLEKNQARANQFIVDNHKKYKEHHEKIDNNL
jgi:hypothetical protein